MARDQGVAEVRPPREAYVRTSRPGTRGATVEVGLEFRDGDSFQVLRESLGGILFANDLSEHTQDPIELAAPVEGEIKSTWPDRAYFIEVWSGGDDGGWIQIFQPFGLPRNDPPKRGGQVGW